MSLERYVELSVAVIGVEGSARDEALRALGSSSRQWEALAQQWQPRLAVDAELSRRYDELMLARLASGCAGAPVLSFDDYVELAALSSAGEDTEPLLDRLQLDMRGFYFRGYEWKARFAEDQRLGACFRVKVMLRSAACGREPRALAGPAAAATVWAEQCPECGAHKITEARTAYIYCDYCSTLFDYDWNRATRDLDGLDPEAVFHAIVDGARSEIRAAAKAKDWDAYRDAWRWVYGLDIEVSPSGWSPRIGEPKYRDAIIEFSVESCVVAHLDPELARANEAAERAAKGGRGRKGGAWIAHWQRVADQIAARARAYERNGLLARHPDGFTAERFVRVNLGIAVGRLLQTAPPEARNALLEASGFRRRAIVVELPALQRSSCGRCGGALLVADGATRTLCEQCGEVLDAARPRFICPGCGAGVLFAGTEDLCCAYCETRFTIRG